MEPADESGLRDAASLSSLSRPAYNTTLDGLEDRQSQLAVTDVPALSTPSPSQSGTALRSSLSSLYEPYVPDLDVPGSPLSSLLESVSVLTGHYGRC